MSEVSAPVQGEALMTEEKPGFWGLMKNRNYRYLLLAQLVSDLGDGVYALGLLWAMKTLTGSSVQMSMVLTAELIPTVLLSLLAGVYVDRGKKKQFLLVADFARGGVVAVLGVLWMLHEMEPWMLIAAAAMLSSFSVFFSPARSVAVRTLVPAESMMQAQSVSSTVQTVVGLSAPAIGALLMSLNIAFAFYFNAVSFFLSFVLILLIKHPDLVKKLEGKTDFAALRASMKEGIRTVFTVSILRNLVLFMMTLNFMFAPLGVLISIYAKTPSELATLETANVIGLLIGSILVGFVSTWPKVLPITVGLLVMFLGFAGMAFVHNLVLAVMCLFLVGLGNPFPNVTIGSLFATKVPRDVLGRASSMVRMVSMCASPLSLSLVGSLLLFFDVRHLFLYAALLGLVVVVVMVCNPVIRKAE